MPSKPTKSRRKNNKDANHQRRFGCHVSVAGGLEKAFDNAIEVGCDCFQIFVKNQRQWRAPPLKQERVEAFRAAAKQSQLGPVVAHASYLLNLASPEASKRNQSTTAMIAELERCERLGVEGLVFHPGAHMDSTLASGIKRIVKSLDKVTQKTAGFRTRILLESTAGQGTAIGHDLSHLSDILSAVKEPQRLGVCLDTCHLFAAGYDFRTVEGYETMIATLDATVGIDSVKCIHVNDSQRECGSRVDRHAHIGKGKIGTRGFAHFVNDRRFFGVPMILETPEGVDGRGTDYDVVNLRKLRRLIRP